MTLVINTNNEVTVISQIERGVQGIQGIPGNGIHDILNISTPSMIETLIESIPINNIRTVKWIITAFDTTHNKTRAFELLATHNGNNCYFSVYAINGDVLSIMTDVRILNNNMNLYIINNELSDLTISVIRINSSLV